jgi:hypothetical protein
MLRLALSLLLLVLSPALIAEASQQQITDQLIIDKNNQMATLLQARDARKTIDFLHSHVSEQAKFQIRFKNAFMPETSSGQNMVLNKETYIKSFIDGLHYVDNYNIEIETTSVEISDNGQMAMSEEIMIEEGIMLNPAQPLAEGVPFLSKTTCHTLYTLENDIIQSQKANCYTETGKISTI